MSWRKLRRRTATSPCISRTRSTTIPGFAAWRSRKPVPILSDHEYTGLTVAAFSDGKPIGLLPAPVEAHDMPVIPKWMPPTFRGIVLDQGKLWLRAADTQVFNGHTTVAITSVPLEQENVEAIAEGLGRVSIYTGVSFERRSGAAAGKIQL